MKFIPKLLAVLFLLNLCNSTSFAQSFWTDEFGTVCNSETLADGFTSTNGAWTIDAPAANNGADANVWYISASENGEGIGNCSGIGCGTNPTPTLHVSPKSADGLATYAMGTPGFQTDVKAISPVIDCLGECGVELSFEYIENGDGINDNFIVYYYDGTSWATLDDPAKSQIGTCTGQVKWTEKILTLPNSANDNPDVQLGFQWVNNADGSGTNPSAAIYNIQLQSNDTESPTITCPSDMDVPTDVNCEIDVIDYSGQATPTDNCTSLGDFSFDQSPAIGSVLSGAGTIQTISLEVSDEAGNSKSCSFDITLVDQTGPDLPCPSTQTENADANCEYVLTDYTTVPVINDNCSASSNLTLSQDQPGGTVVNTGTTTIELKAEDEAGNISACSFDLEVIDVTAPVISSCASDQFENADVNCETIVGDYTGLIAVSDACENNSDLIISQSPTSGTSINGVTTVIISVEDLSGNSSTCDFQVIPNDLIKPVADCSTDTTIYGGANCEYPAPDVTGIVTGTDNCSAFIDMTLSQNITPGSTLSAPQLIYVTLTDENGNTNTCTVQVDILDTIVPSISCPTTQTVSNGTNCDYQITDFTSLVTATDNCSTVTLTQLPGPGDEIGTGFHPVQIIAEDASGNKDTCSFSLQVKETVPPAISCPDDIVTCDSLVSYATPQVVENCPNFNSNQTDLSGFTSGDSFPVGVTNQEYTVIDASGNVASCNFDIEILPPLSTAEINTLTTQFCDTINTIIEAVVPVNGTGEWSVLEGGSVLNNESASTTGVNNLSYGANVFVWTVSSPICGSNSDTITVTVYEEPLSVNTQDSLTLCNDTLINIAASPASAGQGIWSDGAGNIQFQSPHSPNTDAYNFAEGWNDITWTVTNGTCPSKSDTIRLFKKSQSAIYTPDTTVCLLSDNFELIGSPIPQGVSGLWYIISGGVEFIDITTPTPIVTQINPGESMIVYGQSHPVCESTTDTLILNGVECNEYDPLIPTVITPNGDGKNDLFLIDKLNVLYPEAIVRIVNRWGNLVFESTGYSTPWDGSDMNSGKILPLGTYFYRIILNDQEDTEIDGSISIVR